jgi:hypothetical protein
MIEDRANKILSELGGMSVKDIITVLMSAISFVLSEKANDEELYKEGMNCVIKLMESLRDHGWDLLEEEKEKDLT